MRSAVVLGESRPLAWEQTVASAVVLGARDESVPLSAPLAPEQAHAYAVVLGVSGPLAGEQAVASAVVLGAHDESVPPSAPLAREQTHA